MHLRSAWGLSQELLLSVLLGLFFLLFFDYARSGVSIMVCLDYRSLQLG